MFSKYLFMFLKRNGQNHVGMFSQSDLKSVCHVKTLKYMYRYGPKFSDRQVWANSADPDQAAPRVLLKISCLLTSSLLWKSLKSYQ